MIFIENNTNSVTIPKHQTVLGAEFILKLFHQLTGQEFVFDGLENTSSHSKLYVFEEDFSGLLDGTYNYYLYTDDELIENGLLVYGDFISEIKEYEKNNITKAYEG